MNEKTKATVFKVVSIIFLVFGIIALVTSIIAVVAAIAAMMVKFFVGLIALLAALVLIASALLEFICGLWGIKRKNLDKCYKLGILILVLTVISIVLSIIGGNFGISSIFGLILSVLYVYCLK